MYIEQVPGPSQLQSTPHARSTAISAENGIPSGVVRSTVDFRQHHGITTARGLVRLRGGLGRPTGRALPA